MNRYQFWVVTRAFSTSVIYYWQPGDLATCWQPGDLLATGVASCCQLLPVHEPRDWLLLLATAGNSWQQLATLQPGNLATWQPSGNLLATSAGNLATRGSNGRDLFRACACDAERTGGWTPWTGEQNSWRECSNACSNVLTHGQAVSPIRSKRSKPLITVVHIWYLVTKTVAVHGQIGTHDIWHNICVCAERVGEI